MKINIEGQAVYGAQKISVDPTASFAFIEHGSNIKPNDKSIDSIEKALASPDGVVAVGAYCIRPEICDFSRIDPTKYQQKNIFNIY